MWLHLWRHYDLKRSLEVSQEHLFYWAFWHVLQLPAFTRDNLTKSLRSSLNETWQPGVKGVNVLPAKRAGEDILLVCYGGECSRGRFF